jgi:hypothetical protein
MTHDELPSRAARGALPDDARSDEPIRVEIIEMFYPRQLADPETAVAHAVSNAALEGESPDAAGGGSVLLAGNDLPRTVGVPHFSLTGPYSTPTRTSKPAGPTSRQPTLGR